MKIVYYSKTGHTEHYAKMLGKELEIEAIPFSEIKKINKEEQVVFMSWVFASGIKKLKKVLSQYNVICVAAVGMNVKSDDNTKLLVETNRLTIPFFYLQGGLNYDRLKGFEGSLLKMVAKKVIEENREQDKELIKIFKNGGDFVSKENLTDMIGHLKSIL
ncbi:MAG: flavodoxin domain-containing protein [Clostridia bacterium]|nr:flavodoxin domain-containing protein [Clostridia bacterium]